MQRGRLGELLGIQYPIIQGGMVWVSHWQLAAACSNAGILGVLGSGSMTMDEVKDNIAKMQENTAKPFAVNIPMLRPDAVEIGQTALDMGVKILITSAGNPAKIVPVLKRDNTLLIHVVPSVRGAIKAQEVGVDAIVCEGHEAGGHNSPYETTTLALTPQVADAVDIPVAAAGGIADGRGIAAVMALGADGAQMGTRFIATTECNAHTKYKKLIVDTPDTGTCTIGRILSPLRVIRNDFAQRIEDAEKQGADKDGLLKVIGNEFNRNRAAAVDGDLEEGAFQAGQSSGLVHDVIPVADLVQRLVAEFDAARQNLLNM